jgi:hypothetical protein
MSISTRWAVVAEHDVGPADRAEDGTLVAAAVEAWLDAVWRAYLDGCPEVAATCAARALDLRMRTAPLPGPLPAAARVVVTASATEVLPRAFVLAARLRTLGGDDDRVLNATCEVQLVDPADGTPQEISRDLRNALITIEHAARHLN